MKKFVKKLGLAIFVTVLVLFILLKFVSFKDIWDTLLSANLYALILPFGIYLLIFFFRTLRFRTLLRNKVATSKLFPIICMHNLISVFMPFRTGEVGYLYLVNGEGIKFSEAFSTLLVARLFDLFAVFVIFFTGFLLFDNPPELTAVILGWFFAISLVIFLGLVGMLIFKPEIERFGYRVLHKFNLGRNRVVLFIIKKAGQVLDSIKELTIRKNVVLVTFYSLVIWGLMYIFTYQVLNVFGLNVEFLQSLIGNSISLMFNMLPIQGVLGLGTTQAAFTLAYLTLGLERNAIILSSFAYHIVALFFALLLGIVGVIWSKNKFLFW